MWQRGLTAMLPTPSVPEVGSELQGTMEEEGILQGMMRMTRMTDDEKTDENSDWE